MLSVLLLATIPFSPVVEDAVDRVEHNTVFEIPDVHPLVKPKVKVHFKQWIFWVYDPAEHDWRVVAWRMDKTPHVWSRGVLLFFDGDVLRRVKHHAMMRSETTYDPELLDREKLPQEMRRGLNTR